LRRQTDKSVKYGVAFDGDKCDDGMNEARRRSAEPKAIGVGGEGPWRTAEVS